MATAHTPSSLTKDNVKFLAIARATDKAIVACYLHSTSRKGNVDMAELNTFREMLSKVIRTPTWKSQVTPNGRHSLECDPNKFHFTMDNDELVFAAITAKDYPIRLAFQMIAAVQQEVVPRFGAKALTCREVSLLAMRVCRSLRSPQELTDSCGGLNGAARTGQGLHEDPVDGRRHVR
jgi:hypothetical protein